MKKIIFMLIVLLFLTGCTANYELQINNNKIKEKLTVLETNLELVDIENDSGWTIRDSFESLLSKDEFGVKNYTIKSLNNDEQLGIEYNSQKLESLENANVLNLCYTNPTITVDKNIVKIKTGDNFECYDLYENLESVKVTFKTNHKVISTNADSKQGNKYIWNITEEGNKNIEITYDSSKTTFNIVVYVCIFAAIIILVVLGYIIFRKIYKKNKF